MESEKQAYLLKYEGGSIEDHEHLIVWASGLIEIENNYEEGYQVERKPEYDKYEKLSYVPPKVLIEDGWWFYCDKCDKRIDYEYYDYEQEESLNPVFDKEKIFCSMECCDNYNQEVLAEKKLKEDSVQFIKHRFPKADIKLFLGHSKRMHVEFELPKLNYRVKYDSKFKDSVTVIQSDIENFEKYYGSNQ